MRRLAGRAAGALPVIFRSYAEHESYINMLLSSYTVDLISPFENRALFPLIEKGIPTHSKNRPACWDAHIGPEENYI